MKNKYTFLIIITLLLSLNSSPLFAYHFEGSTVVRQESSRGLFNFVQNLFSFSFSNDSLSASATKAVEGMNSPKSSTTTTVSKEEPSASEMVISNTIKASSLSETKKPTLPKIVPVKNTSTKITKTVVDSKIEEKHKIITKLAEKNPAEAISYIEKNKLVGKKQTITTPVIKVTKKNLIVIIGHVETEGVDKASYFATYVSGKTVKTIFAKEFEGLDGSYKITQLVGYQFGNNIIITQLGDLSSSEKNNITPLSKDVDLLAHQNLISRKKDINIAVILINYPGAEPDSSFTTPEDTKVWFDTNIKAYFEEQSYGKIRMNTDVYGWFSSPISDFNSTGNLICNPLNNTISTNPISTRYFLRSHEVRQNLFLTDFRDKFFNQDYDILTFIVDCPITRPGGGWALGSMNASVPRYFEDGDFSMPITVHVNNNGNASLQNVAHEIGHILGGSPSTFMGHADSNVCDEDRSYWAPNLDDCFRIEYGNPFDIMGYWKNWAQHFNTITKKYLGWLESDRILSITAPGTYTIRYQESPTGIVSAEVKINGLKAYIIEKRKAFGFDNSLGNQDLSSNQEGVFVYNGNGSLIDMSLTSQASMWHPDSEDSKAVTLLPGNEFSDGFIRIKVLSSSGDESTFSVSYENMNCNRSAPETVVRRHNVSSFLYTPLTHTPGCGTVKYKTNLNSVRVVGGYLNGREVIPVPFVIEDDAEYYQVDFGGDMIGQFWRSFGRVGFYNIPFTSIFKPQTLPSGYYYLIGESCNFSDTLPELCAPFEKVVPVGDVQSIPIPNTGNLDIL